MTNTHSIGKFEYVKPDSLSEALDMLKSNGAQVRIMAGGTDLILQMKQGQITPAFVLDVKNIPELNRLEWNKDEGLHIGAALPLSKLLAYPGLSERFGIIAQACSVIGSMQIKNRGTVGGNVCNAAPSADSAPALLCMEAKALLASTAGTRSVDLTDFFIAPGKTGIRQNELLVEIEVPNPPDHSAGCYISHTLREEMDIAAAGVAAFLVLSPENRELEEARIALGAVAPTPIRAFNAEAELAGKPVTVSTIEAAAEKAAGDANPVSDLRASAEYRRELIRVLTRRTLQTSCEMLGIQILRT